MSKKQQSAFMSPVEVSESLAVIVGRGAKPRTEITKKLWEYIRKHKLQDAKNRRQINPDGPLSEVIGKKPIDMFKMTKEVSKHIKTPSYASR